MKIKNTSDDIEEDELSESQKFQDIANIIKVISKGILSLDKSFPFSTTAKIKLKADAVRIRKNVPWERQNFREDIKLDSFFPIMQCLLGTT